MLTSFFRLPARLRFLAALLALAGTSGLLSGCDKADVNSQAQAGAWHIKRISTQDGLDPATSTTTVSDVGDVTFVAKADDSAGDEVHFYFDKAFRSRFFQNLGAAGAFRYTPEPHERHRVIISYLRSSQPDLVTVYTLTEDHADRQRWLKVEADANDRITYREEWELERL